ncbi:uncharacterized protein toporsb [Pholidichthys leucotaenia]
MPHRGARSSSRRSRRRDPNEESAAEVMAPTRMKLRVRRNQNAAADTAGGGGAPQAEDEGQSRDGGGRSSGRTRKGRAKTSAVPSSSSSPPSTSSGRAVRAAEEASPDSKCPICLDRFNNLAYLDRCLHRFCFHCIQEWSHNKPECPLCKQPFASILHSVRAEDDFKEYTLRPAPASSGGGTNVTAAVAMVASLAGRNSHQMRLLLRRRRVADGPEVVTRRRRRHMQEAGNEERPGLWYEWYLDSPPHQLPPPPLPDSPEVTEESDETEELGEQWVDRGVIFNGQTEPSGTNRRVKRRLTCRLAVRRRLQRVGTTPRMREREVITLRSDLYRCGIRVQGIAGVNSNQGQQQQQRDITVESFSRNPGHLNRLRLWLYRELRILYGRDSLLVDIVQRVILSQLLSHGLENTATIEEEVRPFLLGHTEHFVHELVSFARSPLSMSAYDQQAEYDVPPLDGTSSSSATSSVIAVSDGEEEDHGTAGGRADGGARDSVVQTRSLLSMSGWDDETPGPSYSTAEPQPPFSPANQEAEERREQDGEECLIVGYKKPIAERTPELVQLSSDTEEDEEKKEKDNNEDEKKRKKQEKETPPSPLPTTPPLTYVPTIPPSTSASVREDSGQAVREAVRARSWSGSSGQSRKSVCTVSSRTPEDYEEERGRKTLRKRKSGREARKKRRKHRGERSGMLYNPNRSIYPALMRRRHSPSPFSSSDSTWEYPGGAQISPLASFTSSPSCSISTTCSSPEPTRLRETPPLCDPDAHRGEKPGGKRKYKSRHLDNNAKDPTWRPSSARQREKKENRRERRREGGRRREKQRRRRRSYSLESSGSRRSREDRSPSVEIIYEGTTTADPTQPPARKRRRRRQRKNQFPSSPVIITLDSDSSHDVANIGSSSSPLSSQHTIDFVDLPSLPLPHSAGMGEAMDAEISELPADILDRGLNGSDAAGPSKAAGPSDNSDGEVDVENIDVSVKRPVRTSEKDPLPIGEHDPVHKRFLETSSDHRFLVAIQDHRVGISAPKSDISSCSPDSRKKLLRDPCEFSRRNREDYSADFVPLLPPTLERQEVKDEKRQDSPTQLYNRNTPPPLKHKDARSPHRSPFHPGDLDFAHTSASPEPSHGVGVKKTIPPISMLKRHFMNALVLRGPLPRTITEIHSKSHKPSETGAAVTDYFRLLDFDSFCPSKSHSSSDGTREISSGPSHATSSSSSCRLEEKLPPHFNSTSKNKTVNPNSCLAPPVGLPSLSCKIDSDDVPPPVFVAPTDSRKNLSKSVSPCLFNLVPTTADSTRLSPAEMHSRCPKSTIDLLSGNTSTVDFHSANTITINPHSGNASTIDSQSQNAPTTDHRSSEASSIDIHSINKSTIDPHSGNTATIYPQSENASTIDHFSSNQSTTDHHSSRTSTIDLLSRNTSTVDFHSANTTTINPHFGNASTIDSQSQKAPTSDHRSSAAIDLHSGNTATIYPQSENASTIDHFSSNQSTIDHHSSKTSTIDLLSGNTSTVDLHSGNTTTVDCLSGNASAINCFSGNKSTIDPHSGNTISIHRHSQKLSTIDHHSDNVSTVDLHSCTKSTLDLHSSNTATIDPQCGNMSTINPHCGHASTIDHFSGNTTAIDHQSQKAPTTSHHFSKASTIDIHSISRSTIDHHSQKGPMIDRYSNNGSTPDHHPDSIFTVDLRSCTTSTLDPHSGSTSPIDIHSGYKSTTDHQSYKGSTLDHHSRQASALDHQSNNLSVVELHSCTLGLHSAQKSTIDCHDGNRSTIGLQSSNKSAINCLSGNASTGDLTSGSTTTIDPQSGNISTLACFSSNPSTIDHHFQKSPSTDHHSDNISAIDLHSCSKSTLDPHSDNKSHIDLYSGYKSTLDLYTSNKSTTDLHSGNSSLKGKTKTETSPLVIHKKNSPIILKSPHSHSTTVRSPNSSDSSKNPGSIHIARENLSPQLKPIVQNHMDSTESEPPIDSLSKHEHIDVQLHKHNYVTSSSLSPNDTQWPTDECSETTGRQNT